MTEKSSHVSVRRVGPTKRLWPMLVLAAIFVLSCIPFLSHLINQISPVLQPTSTAPINQADTAWIITATALVLFMTPGLAFFYGGMVSRRHVITLMFQSFIAMGVISLLWVVCGFSLSFGTSINGLIGDPRTFFLFQNVHLGTDAALAPTIPLALFALFQMKFAIITPALVTGSFGERIKFASFVLFMILFTIFIYAPLAHWTWHPEGILRKWGVLDFAGGTVVHMTAGFAGLAGALLVRSENKAVTPHTPANIPFVLLGTGLLWFGWFGFNAGSALAANGDAVLAFMTTNTAAAAAMVAWLLVDYALGREISALNAAIAAVVGLVAVTPAAGFVSVGSSIAIGILGSVVSNYLINLKWLKRRIADTLDVLACHGAGGVVGMIATSIFTTKGGLVTGQTDLLVKHLLATVLVAIFAFTMSVILFKVVGFILSLGDHSAENADDSRSADLAHTDALHVI